MATAVGTRQSPEGRGAHRRRLHVRRGGRRRHDHLRRRARRAGGRGRRGRRRARRLAGRHEQRDAGPARPRRRPLPDGAAREPAPGDGRLGRGDHHRQPRVGEPLRPRQRRARDLRGERQDRVDRARHGRVGPDRRGPRDVAPERTKDAVAALAGKTQCHVTTPLGTDFYVSIEGRPAPRAHAL